MGDATLPEPLLMYRMYRFPLFNNILFHISLLGALPLSGCGVTQTEPVKEERSVSAQANRDEAESCLRTKILDDYQEDWAVRTTNNKTLQEGEDHVYSVILYAGNEYRIQGCGDQASVDVDLVLYDADGNEIDRDESVDREPLLMYTPRKTATFYVVLHAADVAGQATAIAMAVTYR
ncbi:MAG: hypothetical protein AAFV53_10055 [Myxococcota bacterium]